MVKKHLKLIHVSHIAKFKENFAEREINNFTKIRKRKLCRNGIFVVKRFI